MNANVKLIAAKAHVDEGAIAPCRRVLAQHSMSRARAPTSACRCARSPQADTPAFSGAEKNPPIFVYDCSGP